MKTLITQPSNKAGKRLWAWMPALIAAICFFGTGSVNAQTWTIGTGTSVYSSTSTNPASPLGYYRTTQRSQYIYTRSELLAAGLTIGTPINQIAFNVASLNGSIPAPDYSIGIGETAIPDSVFTSPITTPFVAVTTKYTSVGGYTPQLGWNLINFNSVPAAHTWMGGNLVVEVCHATYSTTLGPGCAGVYYNTKTGSCLNLTAQATITYCGLTYPAISAVVSTIRPNIRLTRLLPCFGKPDAGTLSPSGTISTLCPGTTQTLVASNYTNALNVALQWESSTNGTTWFPIAGANSSVYTTPPLVSNIYYRFKVTCNNSGLDSASPIPVNYTFTSGFPVYGSMPYFEGFENWGNGCAVGDRLTSNNWTNLPSTGNSSWRRDDTGISAGWTNPTLPIPSLFYEGKNSARWHGRSATAGDAGAGTLSLYVNTATAVGNKDLSFYYNFKYNTTNPTYPGDSLKVDTSTDGGITWGPLAWIGQSAVPVNTWNKHTIYNIPVNSTTTIFRFTAKQNFSGYDDIYLDAVSLVPPCQGMPTAGVIDSVVVCSGRNFTLTAQGTSNVAGLAYTWQYKPFGSQFWTSLPGGNVPAPTANITVNTSFRLIVTCTNSSQSDTSAVRNLVLAPFYYCYCSANQNPTYNNTGYVLVGNTSLTSVLSGKLILNNGNPFPTVSNSTTSVAGYEDFTTTVPPAVVVLDSTYELSVTQTGATTSFYLNMYGAAWLDVNRNGVFDASERVMFKIIPGVTNPTAKQTFTIPGFAPVGLTGLRTTIQNYNTSFGINPCGLTNLYGQYEDYLVRIEYQPCTGPVNAGIAIVSDSFVCPGYTVDLIDTTYEKTRTDITRYWQVSVNGGASYSVIPGSMNMDILANHVVGQAISSWYRLMAICDKTGDTTYSNPVVVTTPLSVHCYPVSTSALGAIDSSDIGTFIINDFVNPAPGVPAGPHLMNPLATKRHSDFTNLTPIELWADSTYRLAVFHTMTGATHSDALISVFMDFNNNLNYDVTVPPPPTPFVSELVYQGRSTKDTFFRDTKITIPSAVIPNRLTGLRVILNNDVSSSPTNPALAGKGLFTSGEVEDYLVVFRRVNLGAGSQTLIQNVSLYPNPTSGRFTLLSDATKSVRHLEVVVSTITGQEVVNRSFDNVGTSFTTSIDLGANAKGIYFVEVRADGEKVTRKLVVQ